MLGNASETEFDIRFSVFGIPCRVHPGFWIMGAIMGFSPGWADAIGVNVLSIILLWYCVVFVSILVHELGHAVVMRWYGSRPHVVLYHMGGYASAPMARFTPWRNIVVSAAGPIAGFMLYGLVIAGDHLARSQGWFSGNGAYRFLFQQMCFVNLWWGLINLLPVFPLDGGRICGAVLELLRVRNYEFRTAQVGMVVGGGIAVLLFTRGMTFAALLFLMLAAQNYQATQQSRW